MAEALGVALRELGNFILNKPVGKLASMNEVRSNAVFLRDELEYMVCFLKDAEQKQEADHRVHMWISDVRKIAEDITSVLADFDDKMGPQQNVAAANETCSCLEAVRLYACICFKGTNTFDIGKDFVLLKERVEKICTYGISNISNINNKRSSASTLQELRRTTSYAAEMLLVGLEDVKPKLVEELLRGKSGRSVVSIHGMGRLGKTTLARNLYNSPELVSRFDMRAWICVSQEYDIPNLLRAAIKSFRKGTDHEERVRIENLDVADLERYLHGMLKDSFLVVVDDVWEKEAWESLKRAFPDYSNGSRVIVTTRNKDVATQIDENVYAHHLRFLDSEESWDLFMAKLSHVPGQADWCSGPVEDLGREMVAKCGGLPLALVVLGGLLAHKKTLPAWLKVKERLWANLAEYNTNLLEDLLLLSYRDLSSERRQCFLYLGIFPEDSLIDAEELMCLWMGETFIEEKDGEDMEDVAESYLNELINRSLLQVAERQWERIAKCRIHNLLRDLAIKEALDVGFFHIFNPAATDLYSLVQYHHRHVVHTTSHMERYLLVVHSNIPKLQSLLFFANMSDEIPRQSIEINYRNLGVLKIEGAALVPDDSAIIMGNLKKLKSLVLVNTSIMKLPPSITNLTGLQTLIVFSEEQGRCVLPKEMSKLTNLRHLICDTIEGVAKIGNLSKLRTLKNISYASWIEMQEKGLVNLRELVISKILQQDNVASCPLNSLGKLEFLHTLVLSCGLRDSLGSLDFLSSCQKLHKLWLDGHIDMLPPVEKWPKSISVLNLSGSNLKEDPIPVLGMLPILTRLDLTESHASSTMDFISQSFPQLEILNIHKLLGLERITLEEGAAPRIKRLYLNENQYPEEGATPRIIIPQKLEPILVRSHGERDESFYPSRYFPRLD